MELRSLRREMNDGRQSFGDEDGSLFSGMKVRFEGEVIFVECALVALGYLDFVLVADTSSSSFCSKQDAKVSSSLTACFSFPSSRKHLAIEKVMDAAFGWMRDSRLIHPLNARSYCD